MNLIMMDIFEQEWFEKAKKFEIEENKKCYYLIIMFDLVDKDYYPVYLFNENLKSMISKLCLSEGKQKLIKIINI